MNEKILITHKSKRGGHITHYVARTEVWSHLQRLFKRRIEAEAYQTMPMTSDNLIGGVHYIGGQERGKNWNVWINPSYI
jgi:hypothetical protein